MRKKLEQQTDEKGAHVPRCHVCGSPKLTREVGGLDFNENGWYHVVKIRCANGHETPENVPVEQPAPKRPFD